MGMMDETHSVKVLGSGKQVIVVLGHDFGTDQSVWKYLVPHLVNIYCVVICMIYNMGAGTYHESRFFRL
jgi:hypothetical protein